MRPTPFAAATHVGRVRAENEDSWGAGDELWVVADGMGGHAGGEVASRLAVEAVLATGTSEGTGDPDAVVRAFAAAQGAVVAAATGGLAGMGTTLIVAARGVEGDVLVASVGDSRAYLLADGVLHRLTADDNEAEALLARGAITAEEARHHRGQYVLTASLGGWSATAPEPTVHRVPAGAGRLLLCSDGLNAELDDATIGGVLAGVELGEAADRLVAAAVEAGGSDNVTVLVCDV